MTTASVSMGRGVVSVKIQGIEQVKARLAKLADNIERRMLVDVMKKSLQRAKEEAEVRAPYGNPVVRTNKKSGGKATSLPGRLKRSFRIKKMRSSNPYVLEVQLQNTAYYALWVEYGHKIVRGSKKKGNMRVVGFAGPKPFMRPTFDSQKGNIEAEVNRELGAALTRRGV